MSRAKHICPICFSPITHNMARTCGGADCLEKWRSLTSAERQDALSNALQVATDSTEISPDLPNLESLIGKKSG